MDKNNININFLFLTDEIETISRISTLDEFKELVAIPFKEMYYQFIEEGQEITIDDVLYIVKKVIIKIENNDKFTNDPYSFQVNVFLIPKVA